jgi:hypothetical protein
MLYDKGAVLAFMGATVILHERNVVRSGSRVGLHGSNGALHGVLLVVGTEHFVFTRGGPSKRDFPDSLRA